MHDIKVEIRSMDASFRQMQFLALVHPLQSSSPLSSVSKSHSESSYPLTGLSIQGLNHIHVTHCSQCPLLLISQE
jgi:hypothetical protein